uniref:Uncharacterized protein n=1 Tax=Arundo donax TaxID=35708 RepID=A0A0A9EIE2_ARUDO
MENLDNINGKKKCPTTSCTQIGNVTSEEISPLHISSLVIE